MDQRPETSMRLPGSGPYYMNQAPPSETMAPLQNSPSLSPFSSTPYQSNPLGNLNVPTLPIDDRSTRAVHAPNVLLPGEPVRRKRGRPRKYGHDAAVSLALSPSMSGSIPAMRASPKKRGRPPGSSRNKPQASSSLGAMNLSSASLFNGAGTMTPHILNIAAGEDIKRRILSLLRGRGAIVVLSGVGSVSAANIRISGSGGSSVTYEGHFDILSLSGSYVNDVDAPHGPTGGLNVTLSGPDGRVTGGPVEAVLIAASVVQVIVGSLQPRISSRPKPKAAEDPQPRPSNVGDSSTSANIQPNQNNPMSSWHSTQ